MLFPRFPKSFYQKLRHFSEVSPKTSLPLESCPFYISLSEKLSENTQFANSVISSMTVHNNFLSEDEENSLFQEVEPYMSNLKYEFDHWDDAIHGYRETERLNWNQQNDKILDRVRKLAFPVEVAPLRHVHVLDLDKDGHIKPHVDAVRFCGDTIAGLSLLTDSVMRLVNEKNKDFYADILLKRRSLYIMKGAARYDYTHEILANQFSVFKGDKVFKDRRISVICRNEPNRDDIQ